jgi:hypothetical protein
VASEFEEGHPGDGPNSTDSVVGKRTGELWWSRERRGSGASRSPRSSTWASRRPLSTRWGGLGRGYPVVEGPPLPLHSRLDTVWVAVSLVPERVMIGTGIRLLFFFALVSTAFGVGVSVLLMRASCFLAEIPRRPPPWARGTEALDALPALADAPARKPSDGTSSGTASPASTSPSNGVARSLTCFVPPTQETSQDQ